MGHRKKMRDFVCRLSFDNHQLKYVLNELELEAIILGTRLFLSVVFRLTTLYFAGIQISVYRTLDGIVDKCEAVFDNPYTIICNYPSARIHQCQYNREIPFTVWAENEQGEVIIDKSELMFPSQISPTPPTTSEGHEVTVSLAILHSQFKSYL